MILDEQSVIIKPDAAKKQLEESEDNVVIDVPSDEPVDEISGKGKPEDNTPDKPSKPRRFHGSVIIDPTRLGRDSGKVGEEIVQHLSALLGSEVEVTLEISAKIPDGAPDHVVRTVTENCNTLHFESFGFEEE